MSEILTAQIGPPEAEGAGGDNGVIAETEHGHIERHRIRHVTLVAWGQNSQDSYMAAQTSVS